ncbi:MAG: hypothetical protein KatS3mg050_4964 [Litorilinea sp.]|nr:MAG: hypothetical protein KatS3mg050_4964 [Litorilinea sp.]
MNTRQDTGIPALLAALAQGYRTPPREYSPVPIWWWSGDRLERNRLRWQLEQFAAGGVYNLIVLNLAPTGPLYGSDPDDPPFRSESWWELFAGVCQDAQALGIRLWFYDQIGFSGANLQGEVVRDEPSFAGQWLECAVIEGSGPLELTCPSEGTPLSAAAFPIDETGQPAGPPVPIPLTGRRVTFHSPQHHRLRLVYSVTRGFDYFNPAACRRLLDMVHGEFERRLGHYFGQVIVGSFQDELPSLPTWGPNFAQAFQKRRGYELVPLLPLLWEGPSPDKGTDAGRLRVDFHTTRAELAEEAFFRPLFDWHERHGLLCGFDQQGPARAGHPMASVHYYADYLKTHRWFTAPGSDHHGDARIHSSLAHLYGRPRVWIEAFHSSGWGGTLEETFDWLLPWLRAGATLYDPHAVYYSTRGGWWEWAPPSTCWRQPYWRHYRLFAEAVSRLCFILSQGHHVCDVGMLFPNTTVQAGLTPEGKPGSPWNMAAQMAHDTYEALVGRMFWSNPSPGVLDQDRRDFDVLDDGSIQRGRVENGVLQIGQERYQALILPACAVLEEATAERLCQFVETGGLLVAVGTLPQRAASGESTDFTSSDSPLTRLRQLFEQGKAKWVAEVEAVPQALADLPRRVDAPVPTLMRNVAGHTVLFVPAAYPTATRFSDTGHWLDVDYHFDPNAYRRSMRVTVRGVQGAPELWDPLTGQRTSLTATATQDGVAIEIPFDSGPAALLVWPAPGDEEKISPAGSLGTLSQERRILELDGPWACGFEPTLDNRFGDFSKPAHPGATPGGHPSLGPVQTWSFLHRREGHSLDQGHDGLAAGWHLGQSKEGWQPAHATFGIQGWWTGPLAAGQKVPPLPGPLDGDDPLQVEGWQPMVYSPSRGIFRDPIHRRTLGPKGHVPEEFLAFGPLSAGQSVHYRTTVRLPVATRARLFIGAAAAKEVWINGQAVGQPQPGYQWQASVSLERGLNVLEFRLTADQGPVNLRASWALIRDDADSVAAFTRPEWLTTPDSPQAHSLLRFSRDLEIPFEPGQATIQVGASGPCRILVNDVEVGRQGGFDPYYSTARVQPYPVQGLRFGRNRITLEVQDMGRPISVVVDGLILEAGAGTGRISLMSNGQWTVQRDDGPAVPAPLQRRQWVNRAVDVDTAVLSDMDPSFTHLWRRPHPLPGAAWLEDAPADDTVLSVQVDPFAGRPSVEWLRWILPPGATEAHIPLQGPAQLWVDGQEVTLADGRATLPHPESPRRLAVLRVESDSGRSGGNLLDGPVTYAMGPGQIELGLWSNQGLESYSGGVRYRQRFHLDRPIEGKLYLDLGRVRGTAEVWVNGRAVGARIWSPYRFEISAAVQPGENQVEVLVFNTLAPYLQATSPTHYIFPGQTDSGLFGPVWVVEA